MWCLHLSTYPSLYFFFPFFHSQHFEAAGLESSILQVPDLEVCVYVYVRVCVY